MQNKPLNIKTTPLFEALVKTNKYLAPLFGMECEKHYRYVIVQGGGDSAKTVSIEQYLAMCAIYEARTRVLIAADTVPNLRDGAINSFESYVKDDIRHYLSEYNKTEKLQMYKNGSIFKFKSFEGEMSARGAEWDYAFFNEANLFNYDLFWQVQRKTRKQILLDFNPTSEFWAHSQIIRGEEGQYRGKWIRFIVDHRHNPFLTEEQHQEYESISDPELHRVYARGLTGKVSGLVLGFFRRAEAMPDDCDRYIWGIDYGYTNDPTALVKVGIKGRKRYFQELTYQPGISAYEIVRILNENGYNKKQVLFSEVDKDMIIQLRQKRINVMQAQKSIPAGISKLKEYECYYIGSNFHIEVMNYKYVTAKDLIKGTDILTNIPSDGYNHLADASRYAHYTDCLINRI